MPSTENVCRQRIDYDLPIRESFSEREEAIYDNAYSEVENTLAIIAEIQNGRMDEDGNISEPLTLTEVRTIQEVGVHLDRALTVIEALEDISEGVL
ncbi:hypothetical protein [Haloferax sp. Q22]|uniref:hypothetical protein n=1 Tax=Haloferax sp. (strain Q22) TaxID=1526048 RepID=UPI000737BD9E|nr:hypothetical protein [Haloferax sp. Q22]